MPHAGRTLSTDLVQGSPRGNKARRSILLQNEKAPGDVTKKRAFYFWICCLTEKHVSVTHNK